MLSVIPDGSMQVAQIAGGRLWRSRNMKDYRLVFIDADDTLFDYKRSERHALTQTCQEYNIQADDQLLSDYSKINKQLWLDYENNLINHETLRTERFKRLFRLKGFDINERAFSKSYIDHLADTSFLFDDAEETCGYLHAKYIIVVITNGIRRVQTKRLAASKINRYVDHVIVSEDALYSKPNIGIFQYAEKITAYNQKDAMIIVGDSLSSDILGGINYGIDTCWLNKDNAVAIGQIQPTYIIDSLKSLKDIL